jgi:hypothetical protein
MVCYDTIHDKNCPSYKNNTLALKGGSAVQQQQSQSQEGNRFVFNQSEVDRISKVLEISRYYITRNSQSFQDSNILNEINNAINIVEARTKNQKIYLLKRNDNSDSNQNPNLKGASDNNKMICPNKIDNIKKLLEHFKLY